MYKELANKTFNGLFVDAVFSKSDIKEAKALIQFDKSLLPNKAEQVLYFFELSKLISVRKSLSEIRFLSRTINEEEYDLICQLHEWIKDIKLNNEKNPNSRRWIGEISALNQLGSQLTSEGLISKEAETHFIQLFLQDSGSTVEWLGKKTLLVYLFLKLRDLKMVSALNMNMFLESNFTDGKDFIKNVKQTIVNVSGSRIPGSEKIDKILALIK